MRTRILAVWVLGLAISGCSDPWTDYTSSLGGRLPEGCSIVSTTSSLGVSCDTTGHGLAARRLLEGECERIHAAELTRLDVTTSDGCGWSTLVLPNADCRMTAGTDAPLSCH